MSFVIQGLCPAPFLDLYGLEEEALAVRCARRYRVDSNPGFPDRVELCDVSLGDSVILVNHVHVAGNTPFRASHAIFVREGAVRAAVFRNEIPAVLHRRPLSLRAFDAADWMLDAVLCDGADAAGSIRKLLDVELVHHVDAHFATRGCFAARIERG